MFVVVYVLNIYQIMLTVNKLCPFKKLHKPSLSGSVPCKEQGGRGNIGNAAAVRTGDEL